MSALAEALLAAQRQAIGALSKAYVAHAFEAEWLRERLEGIGATDTVDIEHLRESLDVLREFGAPAPPNGKPDPATEPASDRQTAYIAKLCDERGAVAPDGPLTKEQAAQVIDQLKAGTYNPDAWTVPF